MGIAQAFRGLRLVEVEAGKGARVGVVAKAHVDGIGAVVDGGLQRRQAARRADQIKRHDISSFQGWPARAPWRLSRRASSSAMPFSTSHFLRAPGGRQQDVGRGGAGDAVVHHLPRRALDQVGGDAHVVRLGQRRVFAAPPFDGEHGVLHHVQRMQLEAVDADVEHAVEADMAMGCVLARQADDEMAAHRNAARPRRPGRRLGIRRSRGRG